MLFLPTQSVTTAWAGNPVRAGETQESQNRQYCDKQKRDHETSQRSALATQMAGESILRDASRVADCSCAPCGRPRWSDNVIQSLSQFPSAMEHSSLYRADGDSHDSSGLLSRSLVKLTQLDCFSHSGRQRLHGLGKNSLLFLLGIELFGIQA